MNVWSALFNLENSFGTHDGLIIVCKEAAAVNDSKTVFLRLAGVLGKSHKYQVRTSVGYGSFARLNMILS